MPAVHCFTSFSFSYLAKARVLAQTVKRFHPDWTFWALIVDREPEGFKFDLDKEPFDRVFYAHEFDIDGFEAWIFRHNVVEACTAVKGPFLDYLLVALQAQKVIYLDPDTAAFGSLTPLDDLLDRHSILLTPHQLRPDSTPRAIIDNEIGSLKHGTYNLGFFAVRNSDTGRAFAAWWRDRLLAHCRDDIPGGVFTDQRWCDLVPCFFEDHHIVRDPGYNVASWNLSQRRLAATCEGEVTVNGSPLRFFHFTKLGPIGDIMTSRYADDSSVVFELWSWYAAEVEANCPEAIPERYWYYGQFRDGNHISSDARRLYANRRDLQRAFPLPISDEGYARWLRQTEESA